ncbi:hypothetical protein AB0D42_20750 [Streptomyces sp. NPDC048304]|uniref:hypothetical protein n=1 Tax=Streptomyces sp. NPDC048304 TaxID=3154820 RepID=UPI003408D9E6
MLGSLVLTYTNASGALGSFVTHPRPQLLAAALMVASLVCVLSFTVAGRGHASCVWTRPPPRPSRWRAG